MLKEYAAKGLMFETGCVSQNLASDFESMEAAFLHTFQGQYCIQFLAMSSVVFPEKNRPINTTYSLMRIGMRQI
jgi:hypothetical protein